MDHRLRVVLLAVAVVLGAEALPGKPRLARLRDRHHETLDILGVRHHLLERQAVVGTARVDSVQEDSVKMKIQVDDRAKSLERRDRAGLLLPSHHAGVLRIAKWGMVGVRQGGEAEAEGATGHPSCDRPYLASPLTRRTNKKGAPPFDSFRVLLIMRFYATGSPSFPIKVLISAGCVPQNRKEMTYA